MSDIDEEIIYFISTKISVVYTYGNVKVFIAVFRCPYVCLSVGHVFQPAPTETAHRN